MSEHWQDAAVFLAVAEAGSFSAAANELDVGQATVSRRIAALERRLGVQLFERGRQGAVCTTQATELLPIARQMASWATEFERATQRFDSRIEGVVRIAAPPGIAVEYLAPLARSLREDLPGIRLDVRAGVDHVDLLRGEADLALRVRPPSEPGLVALKEIEASVGVYASQSYAATVSQPCGWADLDWVTWSGRLAATPPRPMLESVIDRFVPAFEADDYLVLLAAVQAGLGAMVMGRPQAGSGLVEIDVGVTLPTSKFYLVCANSASLLPRVAAVAERIGVLMDERIHA